MLPFNEDFRELLSCLLDADVRFLVIGAYAVAFHGYVRATKDIDLWVKADPENAKRAFRALTLFGAPLDGVEPGDLLDPETVLQIGLPPRRVDILSEIEGVQFDDAWRRREQSDLDGLLVPVLGLDDLIEAKRATNRSQDRADVEALERIRSLADGER